jgi:hypothetical protein
MRCCQYLRVAESKLFSTQHQVRADFWAKPILMGLCHPTIATPELIGYDFRRLR